MISSGSEMYFSAEQEQDKKKKKVEVAFSAPNHSDGKSKYTLMHVCTFPTADSFEPSETEQVQPFSRTRSRKALC